MSNPEFVYTTYMKTTPQAVWSAITNPEFTRQYWGGYCNVSDWSKGSKWQHLADDEKRSIRVEGQVVECVPPKLLVLTWADPADPADNSQVKFEIEPIGDMVCLKVLHHSFRTGSSMAEKVSMGWPRVLSSLKSFLETGVGLDIKAIKKC